MIFFLLQFFSPIYLGFHFFSKVAFSTFKDFFSLIFIEGTYFLLFSLFGNRWRRVIVETKNSAFFVDKTCEESVAHFASTKIVEK